MSSSQPLHLQLYKGPTTLEAEAEVGRSFTLFPQLPTEIRLKIWRESLKRSRILALHIENKLPLAGIHGQPLPFQDGTPGRREGGDYRLRVDSDETCEACSKLFRVNNESRQAALEFYRVHLPCTFGNEMDPSNAKEGLLYFNPEHDFLDIVEQSYVAGCRTLPHFLYDLKSKYDPQHVGLLNLAVNGNEMGRMLSWSTNPSDFDIDIREAVVKTIMQLQEVFFVTKVTAGRVIHRRLQGLNINPGGVFNRSYPITSRTASFDRLRRDPRPITRDLKQILWLTFHPQEMFHKWTQVLDKWAISPTHISYRFLVSCNPLIRHNIDDRDSANAWLEKEEGFWRDARSKDPPELSTESDNLEQGVQPAVGFWLFPIEAIGTFGDQMGYECRMVDLTDHWPELGLSCLQ